MRHATTLSRRGGWSWQVRFPDSNYNRPRATRSGSAIMTSKSRRKQRLGPTRKRTTGKQKQADPTGPTDEEFAALKPFKSARGTDQSSPRHRPIF